MLLVTVKSLSEYVINKNTIMSIEPEKIKKANRNLIIVVGLLLLGFVVFLLLKYQSDKNNSIVIEHDKSNEITATDSLSSNSAAIGKKIDFLRAIPIGNSFADTPRIANIAATDLDNDGLLDVIVCDMKTNTVSWIRQFPVNVYTESIISSELKAPAHVQVIDFDGDGDKDLMIAVLGVLYPSNEKIGSVVVLENTGKCHFKAHVIAEKIARVADVRAGDLDGDGDMDLGVAQFGYNDGETRWIENKGNWKFQSHGLQNLSGPINVVLSDIDKDGDLDIVSVVSQEWEEIYCFINDGKGHFKPKLLWGSTNEDFGSSGIFLADIDNDGDDDILYTNGDSFNYTSPADRPWHGVQWLENKGNLNFEYHRICHFTGAYNIRPVDIDKDGDDDLFVVSAFNVWDNPGARSFIWLENTGGMHFTKHDIASSPTHLITLDTGDFNGDGLIDFVTGGMHVYPPYNRMGRVTLWINNGALSSKK